MPESATGPLPTDAHRQAARLLLEGFGLSDADLARHLDQALARPYWRHLAPDLSIEGPIASELLAIPPLEQSLLHDTRARVATEGYFALSDVIPIAVVDRMRAAVRAVLAADWPPVFAWVYDEFWRIARIAPLVEFLSACLGPGYWQTPYVWTHVVAGERGATGWQPHVDNATTDRRLTVWIPLTDASVASGCMSVVPKHLAPRREGAPWHTQPTLPTADALALLHASRALPSGPGGVLGWESHVMHWGAARQAGGDPRISVSMEFIAADSGRQELADAVPGSASALPAFEERLRIIARGVTLYQSSEPRAGRYKRLADRLAEQLSRD